MALDFKVELVGISDTGKTIAVRDVTGLYDPADNPGGWGTPNPEIGDIDFYLLSLSHFSLPDVYWQRQVRVATEPNDQLTPSVPDIANGNIVRMDSVKLGMSTDQKTFNDGVYDINVYAVLDYTITCTANNGATFLLPTNPIDVSMYDVVYVDGKLYDLDHSKDTAGGTVIYVVQELKMASGTMTISPGFRANVKTMKDLGLRTCIYNSTGNMYRVGCNKKCKQRMLDVAIDQWFAELAFEDEDYVAANELILSASKTCRKECGC